MGLCFLSFNEVIIAHKQEDICDVDIAVSLSQQEKKNMFRNCSIRLIKQAFIDSSSSSFWWTLEWNVSERQMVTKIQALKSIYSVNTKAKPFLLKYVKLRDQKSRSNLGHVSL